MKYLIELAEIYWEIDTDVAIKEVMVNETFY